MKPRVTRKQKTLAQITERIENLEKIVVSVLLRLEKLDGVSLEEKKIVNNLCISEIFFRLRYNLKTNNYDVRKRKLVGRVRVLIINRRTTRQHLS